MKYFLFFFYITLGTISYAADNSKSSQPLKTDSNAPVEISADSLEVLQRENKAIFKGNVIAVQGNIRIKSDNMTVHYKPKEEKTAQPAKTEATPAKASGDMGAITLIEVQGNVVIATPEESAQGEKGEYAVPTRLLHLYGNNVVLTRGKNILRGTTLEYNMETGRSLLTNKTGIVSGKPVDTRVRGVFVPNEDANKPK